MERGGFSFVIVEACIEILLKEIGVKATAFKDKDR
jgi:hypothetical protein